MMTVGELIDKLKTQNPDDYVYVENESGWDEAVGILGVRGSVYIETQ